MKTIVNKEKNYKRVSDSEASSLVGKTWKYCPKSEWKTNVRDFEKNSKGESKTKKKDKVS